MLDDYRDVTRDQRSAVDRVSVSVKSSKSGFFDHHRHAINFQEQGNGCHLMKMMSTIGFLFFYSEANVRTIWYLFVAFACRNWEFLPSSIWTIIFLQKQLIWYDVKNWKPQTHYKDLCCICQWNLKAISMQNGLYLIWKTIIILFFTDKCDIKIFMMYCSFVFSWEKTWRELVLSYTRNNSEALDTDIMR